MNSVTHSKLPSVVTIPSTHGSDLLDWLTGAMPRRFLLPLTGLWILGLDWLLFSQDMVTLGLSIPLTALIGFLAGAIGTYRFQREFAGNERVHAGLKALLAGLAVGVPLPLAGTVVGGWILAKSGLAAWKSRILSSTVCRGATMQA